MTIIRTIFVYSWSNVEEWYWHLSGTIIIVNLNCLCIKPIILCFTIKCPLLVKNFIFQLIFFLRYGTDIILRLLCVLISCLSII